MDTTYILVDFENVQPAEVPLLDVDRHKVMLFHGAQPAKVDLSLARALQPLGNRVEYIPNRKVGKNALDFQLAFFAGRLLERHAGVDGDATKSARFLIVSKDTGFDALVLHIESIGYVAVKAASIREGLESMTPADYSTKRNGVPAATKTVKPAIVNATPAKTTTIKPKVDPITRARDHLHDHPKNRPSTRIALVRHLTTLFGSTVDANVQSIIAALEHEGTIVTTGAKVAYPTFKA